MRCHDCEEPVTPDHTTGWTTWAGFIVCNDCFERRSQELRAWIPKVLAEEGAERCK